MGSGWLYRLGRFLSTMTGFPICKQFGYFFLLPLFFLPEKTLDRGNFLPFENRYTPGFTIYCHRLLSLERNPFFLFCLYFLRPLLFNFEAVLFGTFEATNSCLVTPFFRLPFFHHLRRVWWSVVSLWLLKMVAKTKSFCGIMRFTTHLLRTLHLSMQMCLEIY